MKQRIIPLLFTIVLATVAFAAPAVDCIQNSFCYLEDPADNAFKVITNNPKPSFDATFEPNSMRADVARARAVTSIVDTQSSSPVVPGSKITTSQQKKGGTSITWRYTPDTDAPSLSTGFYKIIAAADDLAGTFSEQFEFIVDREGPQIDSFRALQGGVELSTEINGELKLGAGTAAEFKIEGSDPDSKNIPQTELAKVTLVITQKDDTNIAPINLEATRQAATFTVAVDNLTEGEYKGAFHLEDTLRNPAEHEDFKFELTDITPPTIHFKSPAGGFTDEQQPTIVIETTDEQSNAEAATCKLLRLGDGDPVLQQDSLNPAAQHRFNNFFFQTAGTLENNYRVTCTDDNDNEGSKDITLTFLAELPTILELKSSRDSPINTFDNNGKITSLELTTNSISACYFLGDKTANEQPRPTGTKAEIIAAMEPFGDGFNKEHKIDITQELSGDDRVETEYTYFGFCTEQGTDAPTKVAETTFTTNLGLTIEQVTPEGKVGIKVPTMEITLNRPAFCRVNEGTALGQPLQTAGIVKQQQSFIVSAPFVTAQSPDAEYDIEVECDLNRNFGGIPTDHDTKTLKIVVDTTTDTPSISKIADKNDNDVRNTQTKEQALTLIGTAEANADLLVIITDQEGNVQKAGGTTDENGNFNVPITLADGNKVFDITINATDEVNNTAASAPTRVTTDTEGPAEVVVAKLPSSLTTNTIQLFGFTDEPNSKVEIFVFNDNQSKGKVEASSDGTISEERATFTPIRRSIANFDYRKGDNIIKKKQPEEDEPFTTDHFLEFSNHKRADLLRYNIAEVDEQNFFNHNEIVFTPPLEEGVPLGTEVTVVSEEKPTGYFQTSTPLQLFDGTQSIGVRSFDASGNPGAEKIITITVDRQEPRVEIDLPAVTNKDGLVIEAILDGTGTTIDQESVAFEILTGPCTTERLTNEEETNEEFSLEATNNDQRTLLKYDNKVKQLCGSEEFYPEGTFTGEITVKDTAGNQATHPFSFSINKNVAVIDTIAFNPSTAVGSAVHSRDIDTIFVTYEQGTTAQLTTVTINNKDTNEEFPISPDNSNSPPDTGTIFTFDIVDLDLADGSYKLEMSAKKQIGSQFLSEVTETFNVVIDNEGPQLDIIHTLPEEIDFLTPVTLEIEVSDPSGITETASAIIKGATNPMEKAGNRFTFELTEALDFDLLTEYGITYVTQDALGNERRVDDNKFRVVDRRGPFISENQPLNTIAELAPRIQAKIADATEVEVIEFEITGKSGTFVEVPSSEVQDTDIYSFQTAEGQLNSGTGELGRNTVLVKARDTLGFTSTLEWEFFIDPNKGDINELTLEKPGRTEAINLLISPLTNATPEFNLLCLVYQTDVTITSATLTRTTDSADIKLDNQELPGRREYCFLIGRGQGLQEEDTYAFHIESEEEPDRDINIIVDRVDPALSITTPSQTTKEGAIEITGTINADQEPGVIVKVNNVLASITGTTYTSTAPLNDGLNEITVTAQDKAGNTFSDKVNITRDTTPPAFLAIDPGQEISRSTQVTLTGKTEPSALVRVSRNTNDPDIEDGSTTANPPEQSFGTTTATRDAAVNAIQFLVANDQTQRFVTGRFIQLGNDPTRLTIENADFDFAFSTTTVTLNNNERLHLPMKAQDTAIQVFDTKLPAGRFGLPMTLQPGQNDFDIVALDAANNPTAPQTLTIIVDDTAPATVTITPADTATTNEVQISIEIEIKDSGIGLNESSIQINITGTCDINDLNPTNHISFAGNKATFDIKNKNLCNDKDGYDDGLYTVEASAKDFFDNLRQHSSTFTINTDVPEDPEFIISGSTISGEDLVTEETTPLVRVVFNDQKKISIGSIKVDDSNIEEITTINDHTFSFRPEALAAGAHNIEVRASESIDSGIFGNEEAYTQKVIIDTEEPSLTLEGFPNKAITQEIQIKGTCSDDQSLDSDLAITITEGTFTSTATCAEGTFVTPFALSTGDGSKTVTVAIEDLVGKKISLTNDVDLDTVDPFIIIDTILGDDQDEEDSPDPDFAPNLRVIRTAEDKIALTGTIREDTLDSITVEVNGERVPAAITQTGDQFTAEINLILVEGAEQENNLTLTVNDTFGRSANTTRTVLVDRKGPAIEAFIPTSNTAPITQPRIQITTTEPTTACTLTYPRSTTSGTKTDSFTRTNNRDFEVTLTTPIEHAPNANKETAVIIVCRDNLGNDATHAIPFTIDLRDPTLTQVSIEYFEVFTLKGQATNKHFLIQDLPQGATMRLTATTDEPTTCTFNNGTVTSPFQETEPTQQHQTPELNLVDIMNYSFAIECTDLASRTSNQGFVNLSVHTSLEATSPIILLQHPEPKSNLFADEVPRVSTLTPEFNGTILSPTLGSTITSAELKVNGTLYDITLDAEGGFSKRINTLPKQDQYRYTLKATNDRDLTSEIAGFFRTDTQGPGACVIIDDQKVCSTPELQQSTAAGSEEQGVQCGDNKCDAGEVCIPDCIIQETTLLSASQAETAGKVTYKGLYKEPAGPIIGVKVVITEEDTITKKSLEDEIKRNALTSEIENLAKGPGTIAWRGTTGKTKYQVTTQQLFAQDATDTLSSKYLEKYPIAIS